MGVQTNKLETKDTGIDCKHVEAKDKHLQTETKTYNVMDTQTIILEYCENEQQTVTPVSAKEVQTKKLETKDTGIDCKHVVT